MRTPAALVAVPLLAGAALGLLLTDSGGPWLPLTAAAAATIALCAGCCACADGSTPEAAVSIVVSGLLAGLSLGLSDSRAAYHAPLAAWFAQLPADQRNVPFELTGRVRDDAAMSEYGASLTLDVLTVRALDAPVATPLSGGVRLAVGGGVSPDRVKEWRAGRVVLLPALLREPTTYQNPGLPDERRALARRRVVLVGTVKSSSLVDVRARGSRVREAAAAARGWARRELTRYVGQRGGPAGGVAAAILIGDRTGLSAEDERRLQEAGTYHVIAISGGNIAILAALLLGAAKLLRVSARAAAVIAIAALLFYALLTGAGASVTRAVSAAVIYLAARIVDHRGPPVNALAVAAIYAIVLSALAPFDPGFILSFGATLGILLGGGRLLSWLPRNGHSLLRLARIPAALLAATVCAELALAPAAAVIFSRITFAGLLLNFAAIPLMTVVQAGALAVLGFAPFSPAAASACGTVTHWAADWLVRSASLVDIAPWLSHDVPPPAWWFIGTYYALCAGVVWLPRLSRIALTAAAACLLLIVLSPRPVIRATLPPVRPDGLRVVFMDVGQGDATVLMLPDRRAFLVDAGGASHGTLDIGRRVVSPALRALGVRRLEALIVSHADPDHASGASSVFRAFRPLAVWEGVPVPPEPTMRGLAALARAGHRSWRTVQTGDTERDGDVMLRVLNPPLPDWERQRVRNDDSLALEIRAGDLSVILPGDVERAAEQAMLPHLEGLAPLVVVKAPHHGSATSSTAEFLAAARPAAVIFSAGRDNRYGHPAPAVVARYAAAGAAVFSTALDGAVILDGDTKQVVIHGWSSRRRVLLATRRHEGDRGAPTTRR